MKLKQFGILSAFGLLAVITSSAQASMILPNLPDGTYRIAFVSTGAYQANASASTPSQSQSISYWTSKAANEALTSAEPMISGSSSTWYPMMSIYDNAAGTSTAARQIAHLDPTAASGIDTLPIYNTAGQLIANNAADLWDGTLTNPIKFGSTGLNFANSTVWTGTAPDGNIGFRIMGHVFGSAYGLAGASDGQWTNVSNVGGNTFLRMYAISDAFTPGAVPEPGTLSLLATGALLMLRRKRN